MAEPIEVLLACLKDKPEERPASAAVVREALEQAREVLKRRPVAAGPGRLSGKVPRPGAIAGRGRVSGKVPRPSAAGPHVGAQTVVADQRTIAQAQASIGDAAAHRWRRRDITGIVGGVLVMIAVALTTHAIVPGRTATPAPAILPSPTPASAPATAGSGQGDLAALGRELRAAMQRARLGEAWLKRFALSQRASLKKDPAKVAVALRLQLEEAQVLGPLERFLNRTRAYFADEALSVSERWMTRSALCDLEVIEHFLDEHHIKWPMTARISTIAGSWDEPVRPWKLNLVKARSWGVHRESSERGYFPGKSIGDTWGVPSPRPDETLIVWYRGRRWRSGLLLDLRIDGGFRRVLKYRSGDNYTGVFPITRVAFHMDGMIHPNRPQIPSAEDPVDHAYLATVLPAHAWARQLAIDVRMVDLPYSSVGSSDPILYQRYMSLVPGPLR